MCTFVPNVQYVPTSVPTLGWRPPGISGVSYESVVVFPFAHGRIIVPRPTRADALHVEASYGFPSQPELSRALWERALEYMALRRAAPQVVGRGLNLLVDDLHQTPLGAVSHTS